MKIFTGRAFLAKSVSGDGWQRKGIYKIDGKLFLCAVCCIMFVNHIGLPSKALLRASVAQGKSGKVLGELMVIFYVICCKMFLNLFKGFPQAVSFLQGTSVATKKSDKVL